MSEFRCSNGHLMFGTNLKCQICGARVASMDGVSDGKANAEIIHGRSEYSSEAERWAVSELPFTAEDEHDMNALRKKCQAQDKLVHDMLVNNNPELRVKYNEWEKKQKCRTRCLKYKGKVKPCLVLHENGVPDKEWYPNGFGCGEFKDRDGENNG